NIVDGDVTAAVWLLFRAATQSAVATISPSERSLLSARATLACLPMHQAAYSVLATRFSFGRSLSIRRSLPGAPSTGLLSKLCRLPISAGVRQWCWLAARKRRLGE